MADPVSWAVIGAGLIAGGASAWSSNQSQVNQQKRQSGLLKDAQEKEKQMKAESAGAEAKALADAKAKSKERQRRVAASSTLLTGASGLKETEIKGKTLLGG